jgi:hypothetical protein
MEPTDIKIDTKGLTIANMEWTIEIEPLSALFELAQT